ncbi:MAG: N-acetylmuramoyl-L-alanine amidase [Clostridia bacterium]|nr:N-acetylmuramoyl-L-alanine amidase [Clostridia bacterium]
MKKNLAVILICLLCCAILCGTLAEAPAEQAGSVEGQEIFAEPVQETAPEQVAYPNDEAALIPMSAGEEAVEPVQGAVAEQSVAGQEASDPVADIPAAEAPQEVSDGTAEYLPQEVLAPADSVPEAQPQPEAPAEVAPAEAPDAGVCAFGETAVVENDTWQDVNLVRADGFSGPLALVNGQLTLVNVTINGVPARDADLAAYFSLGPTGSVVIRDGGALALNLSAFSFNKGSKRTLMLTENGVEVPGKRARWASSDKKVAKVSKGVVSGKRAGTAVIAAEYNGASVRCLVAVTDFKQVKSVKFNKSKLSLALYGSVQLAVAIRPADAYDPTLTWTSSAPEIVSVDQNGWIAGLSGGKATVTATASNGKKASCKVTVEEIKPKAVRFEQSYVSLNPGNTYATRVSFEPETVSNPSVTFASDNPAVATVDASGIITANDYGKATITVTSASSGVNSACRVSVMKPGTKRMEGLIIGINPGHQKRTVTKLYPLAPGSSQKAKGVKTGACGKWTRVNEYETVLAIGLKLKALLENEGATVVITRTTNDVMLTNIDRAKMLNDAGVDVALQLHCNSVSNQRAEGFISYIRTTTEYADVNRAIGQAIADAASAECGCVNHGVKVQNGYMSLNWTTTPSVLLEMGYISNRKEDALLATDEYRDRMAHGIMEGLCTYFGR